MLLITKNGLCFRSSASRPLSLRARPAAVPPFWRMLVADRRLARQSFAQQLLVLTAKNIAFRLARHGRQHKIYVPPLAEGVAMYELLEFAAEPTRPALPPLPLRSGASPASVILLPAFFFIALLLWHGQCAGWWSIPGLPQLSFDEWQKIGALDVYRTRAMNEWYRLLTALSLHADSAHLFGNIAAGMVFVFLLCRRTGSGLGLLVCVLGGLCGNACNVLYRPFAFSSLGFSTALFAAIGALSSFQAMQDGRSAWRKALLPLGAGGGLLAMLGTEGARTDYAAHLFGMAAGLVLGAASHVLSLRVFPAWWQVVAGNCAWIIFVLAWLCALR